VKYKKKHMITVLELLESVGNFELDLSYASNAKDRFVLTVRGGGKAIDHPPNIQSAEIQFYLTLLLRDGLITGQKYHGGNFGQLSINISGLQMLEELRDKTGLRFVVAWLKGATGILITHVALPMLVALTTILIVEAGKSGRVTVSPQETLP